MKKFLSILLVFAALLMVSCSNDSKKNGDLDGTWIGKMNLMGLEVITSKIEIDGDTGKGYQTDDNGETWEESGEFTVTVEGKKIILDKGKATEMTGTISDDGKSFTVSKEGFTFTFTKQ